MQIPLDATLVSQITLLIEGCSRHAFYRGKKPPTTDCAACHLLYEARTSVGAFLADGLIVIADPPLASEMEFSYNPLCQACVQKQKHTASEHFRQISAQKRGT